MQILYPSFPKPRLALVGAMLAGALLFGCNDAEPTNLTPDVGQPLEELYDSDARWWVKSELLYTTLAATDEDGTIYFGAWDHNLYALNPDGSVNWTVETGAKIDAAPAVAPDGTIFAGSWDHNLYAINSDGSEKWRFEADSHLDNSPSIDAQGRVYIASDTGTLYRLSPDGEVDAQLALPGPATTAVSIFDDGTEITLFVGTVDNAVHCISEAQLLDATFSSTEALPGYAMDDIALDADGFAYVGTQKGHVVKIAPDCSLAFTSESLTYASVGSPTLDAQGGVYVGLLNDQIARLSATDGARIWAKSTERKAPLLAAPTLSSDGKFYAGANGLISFTADGTVEVISQLDVLTSPLIGADMALASTERGALINLDFDLGELGASDWPIQHGNAQRTNYLKP